MHLVKHPTHSKLNNKFDVEDARDLSDLFSNPQPATVMPAISTRRLSLAGEKPVVDDTTPLHGGKL